MKKRLVLLVDEDVRTARLLAKLLGEDGYDVEVSTDGASAVGRLSRPPAPDVLITDLCIAHADGMAVARYACVQNPGIRIFFVTGYPELITKSDDPLVPFAQVFAKPLAYRELIEAMDGPAHGFRRMTTG